jgi:hypothetical protein
MSHLVRTCLVPTLVLGLAVIGFGSAPPARATPKIAYRLSGPCTHENLTIFFIHGADQVKGKKLLTLDEALAQKKAIVRETRNVNQLTIENVSTTHQVFVQAGDIVKGGQQDRTLAVDMVLQPRSGRVPIPAFCVEAGRWHKRGAEDARAFSRSRYTLTDKSQKLAVRGARSQDKVWKSVARAQLNLNRNLMTEVRSGASRSSLQLTLENKKLLAAVNAYAKKLQPKLARQTDVIGYAVVINGKVSSADVYLSHELFRKLWPKLIRASAVEAVTELEAGKKFTPVKARAVTRFLADAEKGKRSEKAITKRLREVQTENARNVLFETRTAGRKGTVLRRSYLAK